MKIRKLAAGLFFVSLLFSGIACHPHLIRSMGPKIAGKAIFKFNCSEDLVALTIDDGPDEYSTPAILNILKQHHSSATFFVIGKRARKNLLKQIVASGNELGNHGFTDDILTDMNLNDLRENIEKTHNVLSDLQKIKWFRPAKGRYNNKVLNIVEEKNYALVLADIYSYDHLIRSKSFHSWYINKFVKPGSIIVLHDYKKRGEATVATLERVLPKLKKRGFKVVSLGEMLESPSCSTS